jgi:arginine N-succinyltransferase
VFLIRSAEPRDYRDVLKLARLLDSYNLPADERFLRQLLRDSLQTFQGKSIPEERKRLLFVAEDLKKGKVVGCSLVINRHGTPKLPHVAFHVKSETKRSKTIRHFVKHQTLQLSINRDGFTEIGGLVVLPRYRRRKYHLGRQLVNVRFAYMAWRPKQFRKKVLVEYLPELDPKKGNKFWDVLGARFTRLSYREADRLSVHDKEFILSLFPKEKIYCGLLPKSAIEMLGVPGPGARASLHVLRGIGFRYLDQVDPFDGGPHYGAIRSKITIVRATDFFRHGREGKARLKRTGLVMATKRGSVRAVLTKFAIKKNEIVLQDDAASVLNIKVGDRVSATPLHA